MKTIEDMQYAVDAILEVCNLHGVVLIGVCYSEGINGEIEIADATEVGSADIVRLTNKAESLNGNAVYVEGIGSPSNAAMSDSLTS